MKTKQERLKAAHTRQLLAWRDQYYHYKALNPDHAAAHNKNCWRCNAYKDKECPYKLDYSEEFTLEEIKTELAKRLHVLNKVEARAERIRLKKEGN